MSDFDMIYQAGRRLVDEQIRRNAHLSSHDLFRLCWKVIDANQGMFRGRAEASELDEKAWRVMVHHDLGKHFLRMRPDFIPPVRALQAPAEASMILTVHTGLELAIGRALIAGKRKLSIVYVPNPRNSERAKLFKLPPDVQYIVADANCLLNVRKALQSGRHVLADCDHPVPENPKANEIRAISISLFELARRSGVPLLFVLPIVEKSGQIAFRAEFHPQPIGHDHDYRTDFVSFLKDAGLDWIAWRMSGR